MTEAPLMAAETTELGVVDPMRVPGWLRRAIGRMPTVARLFVALALIDIVARFLGVFEPRMLFYLEAPLAVVANFVPRTLWILLPAIIVMRRSDAARTAPWIFRGALVLALTTLVVDPLSDLLTPSSYALDQPLQPMIFAATNSILLTSAWLMLANGFRELRPRPATPAAAALANLIGIGFILTAAIAVVQTLQNPAPDWVSGGVLTNLVVNLLATVYGLAIAYALWILVRGFGDRLRPVRATLTAVASATLWASAAVLGSVTSVWFLIVQPPFGDLGWDGAVGVLNAVGWLGAVAAPSLLVLAFAIGLADPDLAAEEARPRAEPA